MTRTTLNLLALVSPSTIGGVPSYGPPHFDTETQSFRLPAPVNWDPMEDEYYSDFDTFHYRPFTFGDGSVYCAVDCEVDGETVDGFFMGRIDPLQGTIMDPDPEV